MNYFMEMYQFDVIDLKTAIKIYFYELIWRCILIYTNWVKHKWLTRN